jgi:hypothetical protein
MTQDFTNLMPFPYFNGCRAELTSKRRCAIIPRREEEPCCTLKVIDFEFTRCITVEDAFESSDNWKWSDYMDDIHSPLVCWGRGDGALGPEEVRGRDERRRTWHRWARSETRESKFIRSPQFRFDRDESPHNCLQGIFHFPSPPSIDKRVTAWISQLFAQIAERRYSWTLTARRSNMNHINWHHINVLFHPAYIQSYWSAFLRLSFIQS